VEADIQQQQQQQQQQQPASQGKARGRLAAGTNSTNNKSISWWTTAQTFQEEMHIASHDLNRRREQKTACIQSTACLKTCAGGWRCIQSSTTLHSVGTKQLQQPQQPAASRAGLTSNNSWQHAARGLLHTQIRHQPQVASCQTAPTCH
jgi:hypothetical protein